MNKEYLELYTDYLLSTFGHATARGLSARVNGQVSHDQITRFLTGGEYTSLERLMAGCQDYSTEGRTGRCGLDFR